MEANNNELPIQTSLQPELMEKLWWKNEESEQILNRGYLLKGETVEGAIERVATAAAKRLY